MSTSSRDTILSSLRSHRVQDVEHPSLDDNWISYEDRCGQFSDMIAAVAGQAVAVRSTAEMLEHLQQQDVYAQAKRVCSLVEGVPKANVDLSEIDDAHALEDVDLLVAPGQFGVAENGAVWVTDRDTSHRVLYFICQHLVLALPADQLVNNMHEAYQRLSFGEPHFGLFIAGPSKTADIEQSLVIGAHGARSLTVYLVG
jgi:L-lactate dehydrogenase complex protein LldG